MSAKVLPRRDLIVGIGAALTVTYAVAVDGEPASALTVLFVVGIVGCVVGLKTVG